MNIEWRITVNTLITDCNTTELIITVSNMNTECLYLTVFEDNYC